MKFICDDNLGKLASYLRMLGFDTAFESAIDDNVLLKTASAGKRFLITRDNELSNRTHPYGILCLHDDDPLIQLQIVISDLKLRIDTSLLFSRCSRCNEICIDADNDEIAGRLFPFIIKSQKIIKKCPSCGRYYWKGSHYKNILRKFINTVPKESLSGAWPEF